MKKSKIWKNLFEIKSTRSDDIEGSSYELSIGLGHILIILVIIILTIYTCNKVG
jgi:hypothetical protein